jgi:hypothetical protein
MVEETAALRGARHPNRIVLAHLIERFFVGLTGDVIDGGSFESVPPWRATSRLISRDGVPTGNLMEGRNLMESPGAGIQANIGRGGRAQQAPWIRQR